MSKHNHGEPLAYSEYHKDGVRFALTKTGRVIASAREVEPVEICQLTFGDTGLPWIPQWKKFKSLCNQMIRDGDVDEIIKARAHREILRNNTKKAAPALLAAMESLLLNADPKLFSPGQLEQCKRAVAIARQPTPYLPPRSA